MFKIIGKSSSFINWDIEIIEERDDLIKAEQCVGGYRRVMGNAWDFVIRHPTGSQAMNSPVESENTTLTHS